MTVAQGQFTIFEHIDGHTPVLGEDYFPAPYIADIIWQYYLSDSVKVLSPTIKTIITFDNGITATVGTWIDIKSESAIPIVKGLIDGVETTYYRFRRQKYIMSDHTDENPHIAYSSAHLDETDQRILDWCKDSDSTYIDGGKLAAHTVIADKLDVNELSAISANLGTIETGEIRTPNYRKPIAWGEITDNINASVGLSYTKSKDYCTVSGIGSCEDTDIVIPSSYEGLPVTRIGSRAFKDCTSLTNIIIPNSVTTIQSQAFQNCENLRSVIIEGDVQIIASYMFADCSLLTSILIPNSTTSIASGAFSGCNNLMNVYYKGSPAQWNQVKIASNNDALTNATYYYYSEESPIDSVNKYWHYDGFKISCNDANMIDSEFFKVTQNGIVSATAVDIQGTVRAIEGKIGGYTLLNDILTSGSGDTKVILDGSEDGNYAFSAGADVASIAPFSVTKEGVISATGGSFAGNIVASDCKIGPIAFNNKGFNISKVTIHLYNFTNNGFKLTVNVYDENRISNRGGQVNYNSYNGSAWNILSKTFTTGGSYPTGPMGIGTQVLNIAKIVYTKPHIAWTLDEIKEKGIDVANLLASGDWEEMNITTTSDLYLHPGSAIIYLGANNNFICMHHFPLMKNCFGTTSENLITATSTVASITCGIGGINYTTPGFYLGTDGLRIAGNVSNSGNNKGYVTITVNNGVGKVECDKLLVRNPDTGELIDIGEKLKNL